MKIDYYHSAPVPSTFANAVNVIRTCDAFRGAGCDITLFCRRGQGTVADIQRDYGVRNGFPIHQIPVSSRQAIATVQLRTSVALSMFRRNAFIMTRNIAFTRIAGRLKRPFAYELHAIPKKASQRAMLGRMVRDPAMARLICISRGVKEQLAREFDIADDPRIIVIPLGADVTRDAPPAPEPRGARPLLVGYVGHLYPGKGEEIIMGLAQRLPHVEFEIIGRPGGLEKVQLPNVRLRGIISHVEAMAALERFDVAVAPYQKGSTDFAGVDISGAFSPLKLFEYMAAAKAIVASDLPVLTEVITSEDNGLLVPSADLDAWVGAIQRLADDDALRARLAHSAFETVKSRFSYKVRAERLMSEFSAFAPKG